MQRSKTEQVVRRVIWVALQHAARQSLSSEGFNANAMKVQRLLGFLFMFAFMAFMLVLSLRLSLGFLRRWTSSDDVFACHDPICFRIGTANLYEYTTTSQRGASVVLYACDVHPLMRSTTFDSVDRPTFTAIFVAVCGLALSGSYFGLAISAIVNRQHRALFMGWAGGAATDQVFLFRRLLVNGVCMTALALPILGVASLELSRTLNGLLALLSLGLAGFLWKKASAMEKTYSAEAELADELAHLTWRLFLKRLINWGYWFYGLAGAGYLLYGLVG